MKILAIRINNLASLQGLTEIDFTKEPLLSAGIFAITGPTGAGKSTILDALCLALYSKTPRYNHANESGLLLKDSSGSSINQGDVRGILRDGAGEGSAEVDFMGNDHVPYRTKWTVKRARSRPDGALQADSVQLINLETKSPFAAKKQETLKEIERLIGLNFQQFTRSVLLAQGDFTAFLKADKDVKASLLEKLTGTQVYSEISKLISEKTKAAEAELKQIKEKIGDINTYSLEEIKQLNYNKAANQKRINGISIEVKNFEKELEWHTTFDLLKTGLANAETSWLECLNIQKGANHRKTRLSQIDEIQQARKLFEGREIAENLCQKKSQTLHELTAILEQLAKKQDALIQSNAALELNLVSQRTKQLTAQPLLIQARKLEVQIAGKQQELDKASNEAGHAKQIKLLEEESLSKKIVESTILSAEIADLQTWRNKNSSRQALAENMPLIASKFQDATKLLNKLESAKITFSTLNNQLESLNIHQEDTQEKLKKEKLALDQGLEQLKKIENDLSGLPILQLNEKKEKVLQSLEDSNRALSIWIKVYSRKNALSDLLKRINHDEMQLESNSLKLEETTKLLAELNIKKESSGKMLEGAHLKASIGVVDLRARLIPHEACPVCGSNEHPFVESNPVLDLIFSALEDQHRQYVNDFNEQNKNEGNLSGVCQILSEQIVQQKQNLNKQSAELELVKNTCEFNPMLKDCEAIRDAEKEKWLENKSKIFKEGLNELKQQIDLYYNSCERLETIRKQVEKLNKAGDELKENLRDNLAQIDLIKEKLFQFQNEILDQQGSLADIENSLNTFFQNPNWISNWKLGPDEFLAQLQAFALAWKQNAENIKKSLDLQTNLIAYITVQEKAHLDRTAEYEKKAKNQLDLENELAIFSDERNSILNGRSANELEKELSLAIESEIKNLEENRNELNALHLENARLDASKAHLTIELLSSKKAVSDFSTAILDFLNELNSRQEEPILEATVLELLKLSFAWREEEKTALQTISDSVTSSLSRFNERKNVLEAHEKQRTSSKNQVELQEILKDKISIQEAEIKSCNELEYLLKTDAENKLRIKKYIAEIEQKREASENWKKLDELVGSADGKKFRRIAQEYTLDILLAYANEHLKMLTNRYSLERVPESLGMQISDKDMGNEIRTVFSLSGGESFLVSLALALGLASLSSHNMKVESLFIDEGFGSLDPTTLNIAMDALEQLHNQGRKVCVISHVQEMTERIPTQIIVSKLSSGRSKVDVLGMR